VVEKRAARQPKLGAFGMRGLPKQGSNHSTIRLPLYLFCQVRSKRPSACIRRPRAHRQASSRLSEGENLLSPRQSARPAAAATKAFRSRPLHARRQLPTTGRFFFWRTTRPMSIPRGQLHAHQRLHYVPPSIRSTSILSRAHLVIGLLPSSLSRSDCASCSTPPSGEFWLRRATHSFCGALRRHGRSDCTSSAPPSTRSRHVARGCRLTRSLVGRQLQVPAGSARGEL
jgi:hypothetical protein